MNRERRSKLQKRSSVCDRRLFILWACADEPNPTRRASSCKPPDSARRHTSRLSFQTRKLAKRRSRQRNRCCSHLLSSYRLLLIANKFLRSKIRGLAFRLTSEHRRQSLSNAALHLASVSKRTSPKVSYFHREKIQLMKTITRLDCWKKQRYLRVKISTVHGFVFLRPLRQSPLLNRRRRQYPRCRISTRCHIPLQR